MMEGTGYSLADIKAVTENDGMFGNGMGGWFWILILFLFRGWGFGANGAMESPLVADEFIKRDLFNINQNVSGTACQTQRDVLENRYDTQLGLQNLGAQMAECCCNTQKEIIQSRYDAALQAQAMQAQLSNCCCDLKTAIHAEGEATRALIQANTIQDLRDKVADRDRDLMTANFQISQAAQSANIIDAVRPFPQPAYITCSPYTTYGYGACGCGCN